MPGTDNSSTITEHPAAPVTYNDPALTRQIAPTLARMAPEAAIEIPPITPSEDFSYYQERIPGVYFFLGIAPPNEPNPAPNHSPFFFVDEGSLPIGVRVLSTVAMDYLSDR